MNSSKQATINSREWYDLRSVLGYSWAMFYILLGGREAGKSYATSRFYVDQFMEYGRPFTWLRLTEASANKLLKNNADKLVDPDTRRYYNLDLRTRGDSVFQVLERDEVTGKVLKEKFMCKVLALNTFYNDKGSAHFDKDFLNDPAMYYNICLDEMNREKNEKNTFDIVYAFVNQMENLLRSTKRRTRIIMIGNTLEEASDLMCCFNFIPETFGRFKLVKNKKKLIQMLRELDEACNDPILTKQINEKYKDIDFGKRAVVEYIEPNDAYLTRRHGTVADMLSPKASTFTNKIDVDYSLVFKGRLTKPINTISFSPDLKFTLWVNGVISDYNGEKVPDIPMVPYQDSVFNTKQRDNVIQMFDNRVFMFRNLLTQKRFKKSLQLFVRKG